MAMAACKVFSGKLAGFRVYISMHYCRLSQLTRIFFASSRTVMYSKVPAFHSRWWPLKEVGFIVWRRAKCAARTAKVSPHFLMMSPQPASFMTVLRLCWSQSRHDALHCVYSSNYYDPISDAFVGRWSVDSGMWSLAVVVIELWIVVTTTTAYALPGVRSLDARLRRAGTWGAEKIFSCKELLSWQNRACKQNIQPAMRLANKWCFRLEKMSADSKIVAGL